MMRLELIFLFGGEPQLSWWVLRSKTFLIESRLPSAFQAHEKGQIACFLCLMSLQGEGVSQFTRVSKTHTRTQLILAILSLWRDVYFELKKLLQVCGGAGSDMHLKILAVRGKGTPLLVDWGCKWKVGGFDVLLPPLITTWRCVCFGVSF